MLHRGKKIHFSKPDTTGRGPVCHRTWRQIRVFLHGFDSGAQGQKIMTSTNRAWLRFPVGHGLIEGQGRDRSDALGAVVEHEMSNLILSHATLVSCHELYVSRTCHFISRTSSST